MCQTENVSSMWDGSQICPTLTARNSGGGQRMPDKENFNAVITYRKQGYPQSSEQGQGWEESKVNDTLNVYDNGEARTPTLIIENHPNDSRVKIRDDGTVQTLSGRMGTGGG